MTLVEATELSVERFVTGWGSTTAYTLENESSGLAQGRDPWVRMTVLEQHSRQTGIGSSGNRRFNRKGLAIWQIFTLMNAGSLASNQYVEALRALFEGVTVNGLMFHNVESRKIGNDGKWYQVNVNAEFEFDEVK